MQIFVLIGIALYSGSYAFLNFWRRRRDKDEEFTPYSPDDEIVYKISFFICTFSLAVATGAALLLPISTIANEILHRYPGSWFFKWLNTSLINGIWNLIFILSNLSLFVFLPFAYLFCESEGFAILGRHQKGLVARAKETLVTLLLLSVTILGMMYVIAMLIERDKDYLSRELQTFTICGFA